MSNPYIICIDDQRDVLSALQKDLAEFEPFFEIAPCETANEAKELLDEIEGEGREIALVICDHVMPNQSGIDFMIELNHDDRYRDLNKILLTGLATQQDTVTAINQANIDRYIEKPWDKEDLTKKVKELLTRFIIKSGIDYQPFVKILDQPTLLNELRRQT